MSPLCLKCRRSGHTTAACESEEWLEKAGLMTIAEATAVKAEDLCTRCTDLNIIELLSKPPPWTSQADLTEAFDEGHERIPSLGKLRELKLQSDCPFCRILCATCPQAVSDEQELLLAPDWTINRVAGELGAIRMDTPDKQAYSTCLLPTLKPTGVALPSGIWAHRGDAICLVEGYGPCGRTLGGKQVQSKGLNVDNIHYWVNACIARHDRACLPVPTDDLHAIRLIDVHTRTVVSYPGHPCEYLALSYVWGDATQQTYQLGDTLNQLPRTLEDAITLTSQLGKRYLWIDSVCINQSDPKDKDMQIDRMWSIYRGAWITVIVLSGTSANSGISRMSRDITHSQIVVSVQEKMVVSLSMTLSMQIWTRPWGQRAWTLQEGLLSPRCLYISDEQLYYDCSSMQCCETLNETRSWAHNLTPADNPTQEGFVTWMLRQAGAGALRVPLDWRPRRLEHWGEKLNLYSYRTMKYGEDAIRAFAGVLQRLETIYPEGFFWGLPVEDFDWALTWRSQVAPVRRVGFPSWSWSGWKGPLFFGQPRDLTQTRRFPTHLEVRGMKDGELTIIFRSPVTTDDDEDGIRIMIRNDPIDQAVEIIVAEHLGPIDIQTLSRYHGAILVDAIALSFVPDFSNPRTGTYQAGQAELFAFDISGVRCIIRIFSTDENIPGSWIDTHWTLNRARLVEWTCILIARDHESGFISHHLMLVEADPESKVMQRRTVFELLVPMDKLTILSMLEPKRVKVILA